jgi:hypothetical protein
VKWVKWKHALIRLEIVLIMAQDRCTVSFWPYPMDLQGGMGQIEAHFDLFRDSVNLHARLVHGFAPNVQ